MKKIFITIALVLVILGAVIFIYRYQLAQYSAETVLRKLLPDYIKIETMIFDFRSQRVTFRGFRIANPPDFTNRFLMEIDEITCTYRMKGKDILQGIEIMDPVFRKPVLTVERLNNGRINLNEMQTVVGKNAGKGEPPAPSNAKRKEPAGSSGKQLSDTVKLPENFNVQDGKFIFIDRLNFSRPHIITFENIDSVLSVKLDSGYTRALNVSSSGTGNLNGDHAERVRWTVSFNPTTPALTMSNRFEVSGLNILTFEPYYDKYSPFVFKRGRFSGTLIFDFDNGNIGSTNEIHLSNIVFSIKEGYQNAAFWETNVTDLAKYFTSSSGDIVFDFKIKGEMSKPQFFLGPISKQALVSMAVDKVSSAIEQMNTKGAGGQGSDIDKAKKYIDMFQNLLKKE